MIASLYQSRAVSSGCTSIAVRSRASRRERSRAAVIRSSRSRARCAPGGAPGRCAPARRAGRARRSCARRARRSARRRAGRAPGTRAPSSSPSSASVEVDPAGLRVVRVEVDDHADDDVVAARVDLAVADQRVVVGLVEAQRRSSAAAPGSRGGSGSRARSASRRLSGRRGPSSRSSYFSESRYSSLPGSRGAVLAQLEGRPVDAVVRAERGGQHEPRSRRPAGRRAAGARAGCPACSARRSAGRTRAPAVVGQLASSTRVSSRLVLRQVK